MSPDTLANVKRIVNDLQRFNPEQTAELLHLLNLYEPDTYLHPASLMNKLTINAEDAYLILTELVKNRILEINFQYYCYTCQTFIDSVYGTIQSAPEQTFCENCENELAKERYLIVIYRFVSV